MNSEASSSTDHSAPAQVRRPGVDKLEEGEELQFDPSVYNYLRGFNIGWPCLSFDIVCDSLGLIRTEFPHTLYGVTGTQAETLLWNHIGIFKLSNISGKKREVLPVSADNDTDMDSDSSSDEDEEEADESAQPTLQLHKVAHQGCVNRIHAMTQKPHICATWSDTGHVQIWDFSSFLNDLAESESTGGNVVRTKSPIMKFGGHKDEGYAIDWSPVVPGKLLTGDCKNRIHLWEPSSDTWNVDSNPFVGHTASVEDLQMAIFHYGISD